MCVGGGGGGGRDSHANTIAMFLVKVSYLILWGYLQLLFPVLLHITDH